MGAWYSNDNLAPAHGYYQLVTPRLQGLGVLAVKKELNYNGFNVGMNLDFGAFGMNMKRTTLAFQRDRGLFADGIIGPITARALFRKRAVSLTPDPEMNVTVYKIASLESAFDPWAYGFVDPEDHGLVQINLRLHPSNTIEQVLDPAWSLPYCARALQSVFSTSGDIEVAVASWNVGVGGATSWLNAGKPATGGTSSLPDLYDRATRYVSLVQKQPTP